MASAFSHAFFAFALRAFYPTDPRAKRLTFLGMVCSALPDVDVLWHDPFGAETAHAHRGVTHSLLFAVVLGVLVATLAFRDVPLGSAVHRARMRYLAIATMSHAVLDMITNGGEGIAFLWPFRSERYFLPWRPVEVSPLDVETFFGARGVEVVASELLWIWLPTTVVCGTVWWIRKRRRAA